MNNKKTFISLAAVIAVAAAVFGIAAMNKKTDSAVTSAPVETTVPTPVATKPSTTGTKSTSSSTYKDGTYSATGSYRSPGGMDTLGVSVTINHDIVTDVSVTEGANDRESQHYQDKFVSGYKAFVVGKSVDSINLGAVSGSSLTPIGFNAAFTQIKAQAKA